MAIARNEIALSSEIVAKLKNANDKPLKYLNGSEFTSSTSVPYYTNWNAAVTQLFSGAKTILTNSQKSKLLKSYNNVQTNFLAANLGRDTPKVIVDLDITKNIPVASFNDLSTFVVNAFLPLTNIRYSSFTILKTIQGTTNLYERNTQYGNALLQDNAIKCNNRNDLSILNNIITKSQKIIDTPEKFLENCRNPNNISSKRPVSNPNDLQSGCLSASLIDELINVCVSETNYIRTNLSCKFTEIPLDGPGSKTQVIYHNKAETSAIHKDVDIYTAYTPILTYRDVFPNELSNIRIFLGWSLTQNAKQIDVNYSPGNTIHVQDQPIHLWPVCKKPHKVTYGFDNYAFMFHSNKVCIPSKTVEVYEDEPYEMENFKNFNTTAAAETGGYTINKNENTYNVDNGIWAELNMEFLCWSNNPNKSPYKDKTDSTTKIFTNVSGITATFTNLIIYKEPGDSDVYFAGETINVKKDLIFYPVFKTVNVTIGKKYESRHEILTRYLEYPYNYTYTWQPSKNAANIGTGLHFGSYSPYSFLNVYKDDSNNEYMCASSDLIVNFNNNAKNGSPDNVRKFATGCLFDLVEMRNKVLNDDAENPRPILCHIGVTHYSDGMYGHSPVLGRLNRNINYYTNSDNDSNFQTSVYCTNSAMLRYNPGGGVVTDALWVFRLFTDWAGPKCKCHMEHSLTKVQAHFKIRPNASCFKDINSSHMYTGIGIWN